APPKRRTQSWAVEPPPGAPEVPPARAAADLAMLPSSGWPGWCHLALELRANGVPEQASRRPEGGARSGTPPNTPGSGAVEERLDQPDHQLGKAALLGCRHELAEVVPVPGGHDQQPRPGDALRERDRVLRTHDVAVTHQDQRRRAHRRHE